MLKVENNNGFFTRVGHHLVWGKTRKSPSIAHYVSLLIEQHPCSKNCDRSGGEWDDFRSAIFEAFCSNPAGFLRERIIRQTLHPNQQELSRQYLEEMTRDTFSRENILPLLNDVPIGDPYLSDYFPFASPLSLQHAYYHYMLNKYLDNFLEQDGISIVEFGGGYGNFCRLSYNFGYTGSYDIVDFPELQYIQNHFLGCVLPQHIRKNIIKFHSSIGENIFSEQSRVLFLGTYSLGETPLETRQEVERYYNSVDYIFLTYGKSFGLVDNLIYFNGLKNRLANDFDVQIIPDKYAENCYFFLGKRKTL